MGKKLAIKGHATRGKEVIELLEMLGGINDREYIGTNTWKDEYYFLDNGYIRAYDWCDGIKFTLEEFLMKYSFKVGDVIKFPNDMAEEIDEMKWDEDLEDIIYTSVSGCTRPCHVNNKTNMEIDCKKCGLHFGSVRCFDKDCPHNTPKSYAVGLKDGKVIDCIANKETYMNEIKPLFKTGDVVKLKGCPDKNLFWIVVDVVEDGYIFNDGEKCPFDDQHHYEKSNRKVIGINEETITPVITTEVIDNSIDSVQFIQDGKIVAVHLNTQNYENEVELQLGDYEIEVRDGKTYAVLKKPKYPTTYAECCEVLGIGSYFEPEIRNATTEECHKFTKLMRLKRCCNAYWKIYGEEMGLGKPWEPDWNEETNKFTISNKCNKIYLNNTAWYAEVLSFPTAEMRDAFYENFKDLIEQCKELL